MTDFSQLSWTALEVLIAQGVPGSYTEESIRLAEIDGFPRYVIPDERLNQTTGQQSTKQGWWK